MNDAATTTKLPSDVDAWLARVAALAPRIEEAATAAEKARRLPDDLVDALHDSGLFRLLLPRDFGGAEVSLPTLFRVIEKLATFDGSTAWVVGQLNGCAMTAAFLDPRISNEIWGRDPRGIVSWGAGKAEARVVEGGYRVTAHTSFFSGGHHATWLGAHCDVVQPGGTLRKGPDGRNEFRTVLFPAKLAPLIDNWDVLGLRATGSDAIAVDDLFVREEYTAIRDVAELRRIKRTLYLYSFYAVYGIAFAAVALGLARAFLDAFVKLTHTKQPRLRPTTLSNSAVVHDELARCEARLSASRAFLSGEVERIWGETEAAGAITIPQRVRIRLSATHAIQEAAAVVDTLYNTAGTSAVFASSPFERRFRDMHMVAQQIQGRKTQYEVVGRWMLGHPPDLSVL
jgi:alkylation response protein AidB-like acyl-CoA dehydrogenase